MAIWRSRRTGVSSSTSRHHASRSSAATSRRFVEGTRNAATGLPPIVSSIRMAVLMEARNVIITPPAVVDRKSVVAGKSVSVRGGLVGRGILKKKKKDLY